MRIYNNFWERNRKIRKPKAQMSNVSQEDVRTKEKEKNAAPMPCASKDNHKFLSDPTAQKTKDSVPSILNTRSTRNN